LVDAGTTKSAGKVFLLIWGAHAPRVLVAAPSPQHLLSLYNEFGDNPNPRWRWRHRQHARRVRSPDCFELR